MKRVATVIEQMSIDALSASPHNARKHSERQVGEIANSMKRIGFTNPILIDERNMILAGEGRFRASKKLGLTSIPCVRLIGLSDKEKRTYMLSDNKIALNSTWDLEALSIELREIMTSEIEIELTGFEMPEIDILLAKTDKADPKSRVDSVEDVAPPVSEAPAVSRSGDVWRLARHRLICGDALDSSVLDRLMAGDQAVMMFTDQPYNLPIDGFVSGRGKVRHREFVQGAGELSSSGFERFLENGLRASYLHLCEGALAYTCMDWRHMPEMLSAGHSVFQELKQWCVWDKKTAGMGTFYRSQHEMVLIWKKGTGSHRNNFGLGEKGRHRTNVWRYPGLNGFTKGRKEQLELHSTVKPVAMVADAIMDVSDRGEIVLDPFGGSGTTLIAAEQTGRSARLVEIDPLYCDVIVRRWEKQTGQSAELVSSNETFERTERLRAGWGKVAAEKAHV
jgi:DNA modification methylase